MPLHCKVDLLPAMLVGLDSYFAFDAKVLYITAGCGRNDFNPTTRGDGGGQ